MSTEVLIMRLSELTEDVTKVRGVLEQLRRRGSKLEELQKLVDRWKGGNTITVPLSRARQQAGSLENAVGDNAMLRQMLEYADRDIREPGRGNGAAGGVGRPETTPSREMPGPFRRLRRPAQRHGAA
jgi:hypothetical protein